MLSDPRQISANGTPIQLQREKLTLKVEEIRGLLAKADTRLREDPENRRRWLGVIENLENSLVEVKARLEHVEMSIQRGETQTDAQAEAPRTASSISLSDSGIRLVENVLSMPVLEVSKLTLEDLAHTQAKSDDPGPTPEQRARAAARIEMANQLRPAPPASTDTEIPSQRSQLLLRAAIDKIQSGRIETMSPDELRVIAACHELMVRRVNPTPSDLRLKRILGGAINILQRRQNEAVAR